MHKNKIAGYYRLSVEDENRKEESNSITNQRILIKQYIFNHEDLQKYEFCEFYDDGISGTTLNRPGLQNLLNLVKQDEIQCIIIKDLSRFSRDYIELGSYLEQIFPFLGIRFIAITDNYDSDNFIGKNASIEIEFKGLLADFYTKDVSEKVKSSLIAKKNQGNYSTGNVPFGFTKNPENKMELLIDPQQAAVVRKIYDLSYAGKNLTSICKELNDSGILTPLEFKNMKLKQNRKELLQEHKMWQAGTVRSILTNENYLGHMIYNKSQQMEVGSSITIQKPRSEWKVFKNHHEPIVGKEIFDAVQQNFLKKENKVRKSIAYPLKGVVYCENCRHKLSIMELAGHKKFFYCSYHKLNSRNNCLSDKVSNEQLENLILAELKKQLEQLVDFNFISEKTEEYKNQSLIADKKELRTMNEAINKLRRKRAKILEDYHEGTLTKEQYLIEKKSLDKELSRQSEKSMERELDIEKLAVKLKQNKTNYGEYFCYAGFSKLMEEMVHTFVKAVYISTDKSIDIYWAFNQQ